MTFPTESQIIDQLKIAWEPWVSAADTAEKQQAIFGLAEERNVKVTDEELQSAFEQWRVERHLHSAADFNAWLTAGEISLDALEASIEADCLQMKLRDEIVSSEAVDEWLALNPLHACSAVVAVISSGTEEAAEECRWTLEEQSSSSARITAAIEIADRIDQFTIESESDFPVQLRRDVLSADVGTLAGPWRANAGWMIACVVSRSESVIDAEERSRIRDQLFEEWLRRPER